MQEVAKIYFLKKFEVVMSIHPYNLFIHPYYDTPLSPLARAVCEELAIPVGDEESTEPYATWQSKSLGPLRPRDGAEKKVQEYFAQTVKNHIFEQFGFFYRVKDPAGNTRAYLFGSIHDMSLVGPHLKLHQKIYRCFEKASCVAFEYNPIDPKDVPKYLDAHMRDAQASQKMDLELAVLAHRTRKSIVNLEPLDLHLFVQVLLDSANQTEADPSLLHKAMWESSEEKLKKFLENDTPKETQKLNDRNAKMAEKVIRILNDHPNQRLFVCVGAGHMVGEKGIPHLLSMQGYQVKQIKPFDNQIFEESLKKDFFGLTTDSLIFIARSISRTENGEDAPTHREMALHSIVQTLLKTGSREALQSAFFIAERMKPGMHRDHAFSAIAKKRAIQPSLFYLLRRVEPGMHRDHAFAAMAKEHEGLQENILKALVAASNMSEDSVSRLQTFEFIADCLVDKGRHKQAMTIMKKYSSPTFHYYPGKVAMKLALKGEFEDAIRMADSIDSSKYQALHDSACAAVAVIMAKQGLKKEAIKSVVITEKLHEVIKGAITIAKTYIVDNELKEATIASIHEIATNTDIENKLKQLSNRSLWSNPCDGVPPLETLFKPLREYKLDQALLAN